MNCVRMYQLRNVWFIDIKTLKRIDKKEKRKENYENEDPPRTYVFIAKSTDWQSVLK